ncbi:MAG: secondary thiamine-phosphate synthase enzyme YjbQ, partial [Kiritimatiellia bacterium]
MERIELRTKQRSEFLNITAEVQAAVNRLERENGTATVFVPHTTAGITINESADPDVIADIIATLDRLIPWHGTYR